MGQGADTLDVTDSTTGTIYMFERFSDDSAVDTLTVTDSVVGRVYVGDGDGSSVTFTGSWGTDNIDYAGYNNPDAATTVTLVDSGVGGIIYTEDGDDTINVTGSFQNADALGAGIDGQSADEIWAGKGDDIINLTDAGIAQNVQGNDGDDVINVTNTSIGTYLSGGSGDDTINLSGADIAGNVEGNSGDDTFTVTNMTSDMTIVGGESGETIGDTLDFTGMSGVLVRSGESGTFTADSGFILTFSQIENVICYTDGMLIRTDKGDVAVENLKLGDRVLTRDNGFRAIKWLRKRALSSAELTANTKLRPICITAGAMGNNLPDTDLIVSPQHRILVNSPIVKRIFGDASVLISAKKCTKIPGIYVVNTDAPISYYHFLLDQHEIILANGVWSESLYPGREVMKGMPLESLVEVFKLFPELKNATQGDAPTPAMPFHQGSKQKTLIQRHIKNNQSLLAGAN